MSAPYRPGHSQWPENRPQRPDRPPPIQFRQEDPQPPRNKALEWSLRIGGLVVVAVLSGLVWSYIQSDTPSGGAKGDDTSQTDEGKYTFTAHPDLPQPKVDDTCPEHAYGKIETFLKGTKCESLTRALYVTKVPDGRTVYTSVSVVQMATEEDAAALRAMTDNDGTGNVNDLIRDDVVKIEGLNSLSGSDGYKSTQLGRDVVIVESDFDPAAEAKDKQADEDLLDDVSLDALRKGDEISRDAG